MSQILILSCKKLNLESNLPKVIANREVCILLKSISGNTKPQCDGTGWGFEK